MKVMVDGDGCNVLIHVGDGWRWWLKCEVLLCAHEGDGRDMVL